jgi:hypothetical protein
MLFNDILTILSVLVGGVIGSGIFFVLLDFKTTEAREEDIKIPYENYYLLGNNRNYILEFEKQENLDKGVVEEETPDGFVIMKYNDEINRFDYWSDKSIKYKYLEVVARKYVILFDCKDKYINMFKELLSAMENKKNDNKNVNNDIFVSYKNYKKSDDDNDKIVNAKSNNYKNVGKYSEFNLNKKKVKEINYSTYKLGFFSSNQ